MSLSLSARGSVRVCPGLLAWAMGLLLLAAPAVRAAAPGILEAPAPHTGFAGASHTFRVTVSGFEPLSFQWRRDEVALVGRTNSSLLLTNLQAADAGRYSVVVTNAAGSVTSAPARLVVRATDAPRYPPPPDGWAYLFEGDAAGNGLTDALDGSWNRFNGLDSWDGLGRGAGNGFPGGLESTNGWLTLEDAVAVAGTGADNRRFYFTHDLGLEAGRVTNAASLLNDGVTLTFRARLTPPADPLLELTNAPNGWVNAGDGKGLFGLRQAGDNGMIISFSLHNATEDTGVASGFSFGRAGLHMNNLNGNVRTSFVDPGEPGAVNVLPLDPSVFHEFWITIQGNGPEPGTHTVTVYCDGARTGAVFQVTAGLGSDLPFASYLALGLGSTPQRGAVDVDFFGYAPGARVPPAFSEPVGWAFQPSNSTRWLGDYAVFQAGVTGTPPYRFQWFRDGALLPGATNATLTFGPMAATDDGALFTVVVSNDYNSITSAPAARLSLLQPPSIVVQPQSVTVTNGDAASLTVVAESPQPISYQWRKDGAALPGATESLLLFPAVAVGDTGSYEVIVSNQAGAITSAPAALVVRTLDFGDAPPPYPVARAAGGAFHLIQAGLHLGASVDAETDGQPSPDARGDDEGGGPDEDGVRWLGPIRVGQTASLEVVASTNGMLDAWADWNGDGGWGEAGDAFMLGQPLQPGTNRLTVAIPAAARPGATFARFRFSSAGTLSPGGPAADGEVEDGRIQIEPVADLGVVLSAQPAPVAVGSNLTVLVTIANTGPSPATGVVLDSPLPEGAVLVSSSASGGACQLQPGRLTCELGTVLPGNSAVVELVLQPGSAGLLTNRVSVSALEHDPVIAGNEAVLVASVLDPPRLLEAPQPVILTNGSPAVFSVVATGAPPLRYEWRLGGVPRPGATNAVLLIPVAASPDEGEYTVRVENQVGAAESGPARLTVLVPPYFIEQPRNLTNLAGATAILSAQAGGTPPFLHQWFFQGTNAIPGATNAVLVLSNAQPAEAGEYQVVVRTSSGWATSTVARLELVAMDFGDAPDPPYPSSLARNGARHRLQPGFHLGAVAQFEPEGGSPGHTDDDGVVFLDRVRVGQEVRLQVVASVPGRLDAWLDADGDGAWQEGAERIVPGATLAAGTNELIMQLPAGARPGQGQALFRFSLAGGLSPVGEAPEGEVESYAVEILPAADLVLRAAPITAPQPVGADVTLVFVLSNQGPSTATAVTFSNALPSGLTLLQAESSLGGCEPDGDRVRCLLGSIPAGTEASVRLRARCLAAGFQTNLATVSGDTFDASLADNAVASVVDVLAPPVITLPPMDRVVVAGDSVILSVSTEGSRLRFQWLFNAEALPGATNAALSLNRVATNEAGLYSVVVSNEVGSLLSSPARLTVLVPPFIITPPRPVSVLPGTPAVFAVEAGGTSPLQFQWQRDGIDLAGETNTTLRLDSPQFTDAGLYRVRVANLVGQTLSEGVPLVILVPPYLPAPVPDATFLAGSEATLTAAAGGTEPLAYQWWRPGLGPVPGQTNAVLVLTNVQSGASGGYVVVVTNLGGAVTSAVATLTIVEADFGDAPETLGYPTRLAFQGAWHQLAAGIRLGASVDFEPDGQPDAGSTGDAADEDGVAFLTPLLAGQRVDLELQASTNGFVDAWIDFGANGGWLESADLIFNSVPVAAGSNRLSFQVPPGAALTNTYARFRFSRSGGLSFHGPAPDGEVEDYAVRIEPAVNLVVAVTDTPDPSPIAGSILLTQRVTNEGPSTATSVWLTTMLANRSRILSITSSQGACSNTADGVLCALGSLAAGGTATVGIEVAFDRAGRYVTRASAGAAESEVQPGNNTVEETTVVVTPGATTQNPAPVVLVDATTNGVGTATPYPSTLLVEGLTGTVQRVEVILRELTHSYPGDLDLLLVGPGGQSCILMSDAAGGVAANYVTLRIDDGADVPFPSAGVLFNRPYRPTNLGDGPDDFPAPAPPRPHGSALSVFAGTNPNGVWSLYAVDDYPSDNGLLAGGWELVITTVDPMADVSVAFASGWGPFGVTSNVICPVILSNLGPSAVCGVWLTNRIPLGLDFVSATLPGGACFHQGPEVACWLPTLGPLESATAVLAYRPQAVGTYSNHVRVTGGDVDFFPGNNAASRELRVLPVHDLSCGITTSTNRLVLGNALSVRVTATNRGPSAATQVVLAGPVPSGVNITSITPTRGACAVDAGVLRCEWGTLEAGAGAAVDLILQPAAAMVLTQAFNVVGAEIDTHGADNTALAVTEVNVAADLALTLTVPGGPVAATSNQVHVATVRNLGPSAAAGVRATFRLSREVEGLLYTASQGGCVVNVGEVACALGTLAPGQAALLTLGFRVPQPALLTNRVSVSSDSLDFQAADNEAVAVVSVLAPPVLLAPPVDSRYFPGTTARLSVSAAGQAPLRYQWSRNGQAVAGATNAVLLLADFGAPAAGFYTVRIENLVGAIETQPVELRVAQFPTITDVPDQRTDEDRTLTVPFLVGDAETPAGALLVTVSCSDTNLLPLAGIRLQGDSAMRELIALPSTNNHGEATLTLTVRDEDGGTVTDSFRVVVDRVNDPPTLDPLVNQDLRVDAGEQRVYLTGITGGPADEPSTTTLSAVSGNPAVVPHPVLQYTPGATEGWLFFTPNPGATGAVVLTVTVDDGAPSNRFHSRSFTVSLQASNYPPAILPIAQILSPEDVPLVVPVALLDLETPPDQLVLSCSCSDTNLIPLAGLVLSAGGPVRQLRVTPATNATGSVTVSLTVTDSGGLTARRDFRLTLQPVNDPPFVTGWSALTLVEDAPPAPRPFVIGDVETGADSLLAAVRSSNPGLLPDSRVVLGGIGANRTLAVNPLPEQFGSSWLTLTLVDPAGLTNESRLLVTVLPANDPPTLDPVPAVTVQESTGPHLVTLTGLTAGPPNELQALTLTAFSSDASLIPAPSVAHTQGQTTAVLSFTPAPGRHGAATVTIRVDDGGVSNSLAEVVVPVTVQPVNDPPVIGFLPARSTPLNTPVEIPITLEDDLTLPGSLQLSAQAAEPGLLAPGGLLLGGTGSNRTLTLVPATNRSGATLVTVAAEDTGGLATSRVFLLTIEPGNLPPTISAVASRVMDEDTGPLAVAFTVTDGETEISNLVVTASSSNPLLVPDRGLTLTGSGTNRVLRIVPATNTSGVTTITLGVRDGSLLSAATSFLLTVRPVNDPPDLGPLPDLVAPQDTVLGIPVAVGDVETPVAELNVTASVSDTNLLEGSSFQPQGTGGTRTLVLLPRVGQTGSCSVTIRVADGAGASTEGSFTLTLRPDSPAPPWIALQPASQAALLGETATLTVEALGLAPLACQWTFQGQPLPGATNTTLLLTNLGLANGGNYQAMITNLHGAATSRVAVLTILTPGQAPLLSGLPANLALPEDTRLAVPFTLFDPDTPVFRLVLGVTSTDPAVVAPTNVLFEGSGPDRTLLILPNTNAFGTTLLAVTASDGSGTSTQRVLVTVEPVNDPPTLGPIPDVLVDGFGNPPAQTITLTGITSGATNEAQPIQVSLTSGNPSFVTPLTASYSALGSTGTITFDSINKASGSAILTVSVNDGGTSNQVFSRSFTAYYYLSQTPPVISTIPAQTLNEDGASAPISFTIGDATTPAGGLTLQAFSSNPGLLPTSAILFGGSGSNRTVTLRPEPDRFGTSSVRIAVLDTNFGFAATTFNVTVNPVNDPPTLTPPSAQAGPWNSPTAPLPFQVGDKETAADHLTITAASSDTNLVPITGILLGGSGTNRAVSVVPSSNRVGTATITLTTRDAAGGTASNSFVLTVFATNAPPLISAPASVSWDEDTPSGPLLITLRDDQTPAQNLVLTATSSNTALLPVSAMQLGGTGANRTLTLTPAAHAHGQSLITLTATDGAGRSAQHQLLAVVRPVNDPPALAPLAPLTLTAGAVARTIPFGGVGPGAPGETQVLLITANSDNPGVVPDPVIAYTSPASSGTLTLLPVSVGTAIITVSVNDGGPANPVTTRTFPVTVVPPPAFSAIANVSVPEDGATGPIPFTLRNLPPGAGTPVITAFSSNTNLLPLSRITLGGTGTNRSLLLQPAPDQFGSCRVTLQLNDGQATTAETSFLLAVEPVNDPPRLSPIADLVLTEDAGPQSVTLAGIVAGASNEVQVLTLTASSSHPELIPHPAISYQSPASTGTLSFQPVTNAFGTAVVSVVVFDGAGTMGSVTQSFQVAVQERNDPPSISPVPDRSTPEDVPVQVGFAVSDLETAPGSLQVTALSTDPALLPPSGLRIVGGNGDRALWIEPAPNRSGTATVILTVTDAAGGTNAVQFQVSVTPVDDAPVLLPPADHGTPEDVATGPLPFLLWDPDTSVEGMAVQAVSSNPVLLPPSGILLGGTGSNRTIRLSPATNQSGTAVITLLATNAEGLPLSSVFVLTVSPVDDAPVLLPIPDVTMEENTLSAPVSFTVLDVETAAANLNVSAVSSNPGLLPVNQILWGPGGSNRTMRFAPLPNRFGQAAITLTVTDAGGLSSQSTFQVTVLENPDPPTIVTNPAGAAVSYGTAVTLSVAAAGTGPLFYQWFRDGMPVPGATNRVFTIPAARPADAGTYRAQVRNAAGMATSAAALLEVQGQPPAPLLLSVIRAGETVQITFSSSLNTRCVVEFRSEVDTGPWSALTTVNGTGGNVTVTDAAPSAARRFYRIRAE